jgi:hypothetical protein
VSDISPPRSPRALPPRAVAALLIAFVAIVGAVAGAAIDRVLVQRKGPALVDTTFHPLSQALRVPTEADRRHLREQLSRNLGLSAAQDSVIDSIMNHRSGEFNALREELRPRVERLVLDVRADIEQVLTPEQRARFHALQQAMGTASPNLRASGTSTAVSQP